MSTAVSARLAGAEVAGVHGMRSARHLHAQPVARREAVPDRPHRDARDEHAVGVTLDRRRGESLEAVAHVERRAVGVDVAHAHEHVDVIEARRQVELADTGPISSSGSVSTSLVYTSTSGRASSGRLSRAPPVSMPMPPIAGVGSAGS